MLNIVKVGPQIKIEDACFLLKDRFGDSLYCLMRCPLWSYPYDPGWKSASKIGSRMSLSAPWTTRSRIEGTVSANYT